MIITTFCSTRFIQIMMQRRNKLFGHHSSAVGKCWPTVMTWPPVRDAHWPQRFLMTVVAPAYIYTVILLPSLPSQEKVKTNTRCCFSVTMVKRKREMVTTWSITSPWHPGSNKRGLHPTLLHWSQSRIWWKYKTQIPPITNINLHGRRC